MKELGSWRAVWCPAGGVGFWLLEWVTNWGLLRSIEGAVSTM